MNTSLHYAERAKPNLTQLKLHVVEMYPQNEYSIFVIF